jgi:SAM-dependent methyltransferase
VDQGLYTEEELSSVPKTALNLSRGCGNPTGFANLKPGEVVVDFGCGGGMDLVLAAHKVGSKGRVVGIDSADQMIERAEQAVAEAGLQPVNIEFFAADLEKTQLPDHFADVVISNCVINLCPNKDAVYDEAFRILGSKGRLAISDIVLNEKIDIQLQERLQSTWSGCLGGAIPEEDYRRTVRKAGFSEIQIVSRHTLTADELEAMALCPGMEFTPAPAKDDLAEVQGEVASIKFTAGRSSVGD